MQLHACVTDRGFASSPQGVAFLPARPVTPTDLAVLTERVRTRLVRWFRRHGLVNAEAAADMLAWENSGLSIDASVRVGLLDRDVPSSFKCLEHLLRYCARPTFALERLALLPGRNGGPERIRSTLPRHKRRRRQSRPRHLPTREAKLMAKIAGDFPLACPACGGDIRLIAFITDPALIRKILEALGASLEPPPLAPARGPPTSWTELVQGHDDLDAIQALADDLPVIDIHGM